MSHPPQPPQQPQPDPYDPYALNEAPAYPGQTPAHPGQNASGNPGQPGQPQPAAYSGHPQQPTAAQMSAHLSERASALGLGNPLFAVLASLFSYAIAVAASVLTMLALLVAVMIQGAGSGSQLSPSGLGAPDPSTGWFLFALPFQLAAMGGLGVLSAVYEGEPLFSLLLVPLLPLLGLVLGGFFGGRIIQRFRHRPSPLHIILSSLLGGLLVAIIGDLLPFILALRESGVRMDASGVATFFGLWFVVSLSVAVGQFSGAQRPRWWAAVSELFVAFKAALLHGVLLAVIGTVLLGLALLVTGEMSVKDLGSAIFTLPLIGSLIGGLMISMTSLAGISMGSTFSGFSSSLTVTLFSAPWWVTLISLVLGLVVLLLVAVLWSRGRYTVPGNAASIVTSWAALPVAYFVSALGLMLVGRTSGELNDFGGLGAFFGFTGAGGGMGIPAWFPLLAFVWGLIVEAIARFAVPFVLPFLPPVLTTWFRTGLLTRSFHSAPEGALQPTRPITGIDLSRITAGAGGVGSPAGGVGAPAGGAAGATSAAGAAYPAASAPQAYSAPQAPSAPQAYSAPQAPSAPPAPNPIAPQQPVPPVNSANPTGPMYPGEPPVQPGQTTQQRLAATGQPPQAPVQPGQAAPQVPVYPGQAAPQTPVQPGQAAPQAPVRPGPSRSQEPTDPDSTPPSAPPVMSGE